MESTGIKKCRSDGGSGPSGHSNGNAAGMAIHLDINDPASRGEEELEVTGGAVEVKGEEENGGVRSQHLKNTQLSEYRLKHRIDSKPRNELADQLKPRARQNESESYNRNTRSKLQHSQMECEYLKECIRVLKEDNRRIQLEVEQLRQLNEENCRLHFEVVKLRATRMEQPQPVAVLGALKEENHRLQLEVAQLRATRRTEQSAALPVLRALKEENRLLHLEVEELRSTSMEQPAALPVLKVLQEQNRRLHREVEELAATRMGQPTAVVIFRALKDENRHLQLEIEQLRATRGMEQPASRARSL